MLKKVYFLKPMLFLIHGSLVWGIYVLLTLLLLCINNTASLQLLNDSFIISVSDNWKIKLKKYKLYDVYQLWTSFHNELIINIA